MDNGQRTTGSFYSAFRIPHSAFRIPHFEVELAAQPAADNS
jgi:hypothetical protein